MITYTEAYIQFGTWYGPYQTVKAEGVKEEPMAHHKRGLSWTATGYGPKIPTVHMVKYEGRWRRVYMAQYGNSGTPFVIIHGEEVVVTLN